MVNISEKKSTCRKAVACGKVIMNHQTLLAITEQRVKKRRCLTHCTIGRIMGAKHTSDLIPLCHPIPIDGVDVELTVQEYGIFITATVHTTWKTGVEMEALTAISASL